MAAGFRLGRMVGVPVEVNWSVLVIFALIAWGLSAMRFPASYPNQPVWAYIACGIGAALIFFIGLLVHELSHAVVARREGLQVEGITLWLFGGMARMPGRMPGPGAELRVAGVGPLVSALLTVIFAGIAAAIDTLGHAGLAFGTFAWLAGINLALAVFNAVPAAPLDGGRLLQAVLWRWRGDRTWAAIIAARAGLILGGLLIAVGLWGFLAYRAGVGGLWLAVLGWFLCGAATAEERQAKLGDALTGMQVRDVMSTEPDSVPSTITVQEFIDQFLFGHRFSSYPLVDDDHPVGLVTLNRVKQVEPARRASTPLRDIACPMDQIPQAAPGDELTELLPRLGGCADGRALVLESSTLVGIVSHTDIVRALERARLRAGTR